MSLDAGCGILAAMPKRLLLGACALIVLSACGAHAQDEESGSAAAPRLHSRREAAPPLNMADAHDRLVQLISWDRKAEGLVTPMNPHGLKWEFKETGVGDTPHGHTIGMSATVYGAPRNQPWDVLVWELDKPNPGVQYKDAWVNLEGYLWRARPRDEAQEANGGEGAIHYSFQGAKGEAYRYMLLSKDQKIRIYGLAIPFPNVKKMGKCTAELRLGTMDGRLLLVRGEGFAPNAMAHLETVTAGKPSDQELKTDAKGTFMTGLMPPATTDESGVRQITVSGTGCSMHFEQPWGKNSYQRE